MRLAPHQLTPHLQKGLASLYILYGPEDFLADESAQLIRNHFLTQEHHERVSFQCDGASTPWEAIQQALQSNSLFATKQLIELKIQKLLPSDPPKLLACLSHASTQHLCLIQCSSQLKSIHKAKWLQTLEQKGVLVPHFGLSAAQFNHWIIARAKQVGLTLSSEVVAVLASRTQGNCLAAAQEIERLALCGPVEAHGPLTLAELGFHHQFDVFELCEAILTQRSDRIITILSSLKETQGIALSLVVWVLGQTLRVLTQANTLSTAEQKTRLLFQMGIRKQSHAFYFPILQQVNVDACQRLFCRLSEIDCQLKSGQLRHAWAQTLTVCLDMKKACEV